LHLRRRDDECPMSNYDPYASPIEWDFPVKDDPNSCAVGGALMCFPESNNPLLERRWPRVPRHDEVMGDTDLPAGSPVQPINASIDPSIGDIAEFERNILKAIDFALSEEAINSIMNKLCVECSEIQFVFRTTDKGFGYDRYMRRIKSKTGMEPLKEKTKTLSCCEDGVRVKQGALDLKDIKESKKWTPEYKKD
jgi:hypothetical protein